MGNVDIAPFFATSNFIDLHTPTVPEVQFESDTYFGVAVAYSHMLGKSTHLAFNLRGFRRSLFASNLGFSDVMGFLDSSDLELDDLVERREGSYWALDSGLIYQPGDWRYGVLLENIGWAAPTDGEAGNPAPAIPQSLSLGVYRQYELGSWTWDFAFDFQDVINPKDYDYLRLLHFGTELGRKWYSYDNDVGLVMGINEGYFVGGAYIDLWLVRLDVTNYTVELAEYPGQRGDRRWAISARTVSSF